MHKNLILSNLKLLILLNKLEFINNTLLKNLLICDNSNFNSDYKDDLVSETDSVNK